MKKAKKASVDLAGTLLSIAVMIMVAATSYIIGSGTQEDKNIIELYFENQTALPNDIVVNQTYNFSYTLRNLEDTDRTYYVSVDMYYGNDSLQRRRILYSSLRVPQGKKLTVPVSFTISETFSLVKISVSVYNTGDEIHYYARKGTL